MQVLPDSMGEHMPSAATHSPSCSCCMYALSPLEANAVDCLRAGAQIISCKIGDSRLGSMETMVGLSRALGAVLQHGVDVINMSYGEPTATPNMGRFIELANEVTSCCS